jgi:hypothetical protein
MMFSGRHENPRGNYWLATVDRQVHYWLQGRLDLKPDGTWSAMVDVGPRQGRRHCHVLLIWVNEFVDKLFVDIQARSGKAKCYDPIETIKGIPLGDLVVIDRRRLEVELDLHE